MNPALPVCRLAVYETEIGFVDESRCLQGMITTLSRKVLLRDPAQFVVDERNKRVSGRQIAIVPADK